MIRRTRNAVFRRAAALAGAVLCAALLAASLSAVAQDQSAASTKDVIFARKALKDVICDKMADIERMIARGNLDLDAAHRQADDIAVMLLAFPHMFPPSSNQWKEGGDQEPEIATLAAPDLWTDFADFYRQATDAATSAAALAHAKTVDDVKARARGLRIACDICHALYLEDQ